MSKTTVAMLETRIAELEAANKALAARLEKCMADFEAVLLNVASHIPDSVPHVPGLVEAWQLKSLKCKVFKHIKDVGAALKDVGKLSTSVRVDKVEGGFAVHV
jgi:hypothetical protein